MGKKSSPSTFLNFFTFDLQITWNLTPPFSPLFKPKLIKDMKNNTTNDMPRETRDILSCECFFSTLYVDCVNHYVIMKTEIRAARALAWRLLGLVTQHSEKGALRDQSKQDAAALQYEQSLLFGEVRRTSKEEQTGKENREKKKEWNWCQRASGSSGREAPHSQSSPPRAYINFFHWFFFSVFSFHGDGLRRRGRTACSLRLPKRLNRRENFVYLKLVADYYVLICLYNKRTQSHQIWRKHHFLISSWFEPHFWRNFRRIKKEIYSIATKKYVLWPF